MEFKNIKVEEDIFWELKQIEIDTKVKKISDVIRLLINSYNKSNTNSIKTLKEVFG